jgi:hypothetical protein
VSRRKRRKHATGGSMRNPNSLANLVPGGAAGTPGNTLALKHGARSAALVADVSAEVAEIMQGIAEVCPVRDADGSLPDADVLAVEACAVALKRWRHVGTYCDLHGRIDEKGKQTSAAEYELRAESAYRRALASLGLDPESRVKLGLNLARTAGAFDLARHWQEQGDDDAA